MLFDLGVFSGYALAALLGAPEGLPTLLGAPTGLPNLRWFGI